jgi:creatinine amidohydrolase/Fe(II)-dependent formamide hydrolase-like protein
LEKKGLPHDSMLDLIISTHGGNIDALKMMQTNIQMFLDVVREQRKTVSRDAKAKSITP